MEESTTTIIEAPQSLPDAVRTAVEDCLSKYGDNAKGMVLHLIFETNGVRGRAINGVSVVLGDVSPGKQRAIFQNTMHTAENYDPAKTQLRFN
ncbi:hypothetical protein [Desulfovibrio psychrotolerans]|uniref:Uncharacterized protein n=1 Tax=Desulfovibrio psychrotolerans TaxID=415242 RepID=A0A7J0BYA7_9BACT|nr:hypothetical protein [Desulfovibrio psychrotolerans]GFM37974.1 hypothetical protein DSM19430T_26580 [Desulfovibrio psychrotolerans]